MIRKTGIAALVLGGFMLIGGALPSVADARRDCDKRVRKAEQNLQHEIDRHGERGKNVERRRGELERQRQNCRMYDKDRDGRDHDRHDGDNDRHENPGDRR